MLSGNDHWNQNVEARDIRMHGKWNSIFVLPATELWTPWRTATSRSCCWFLLRLSKLARRHQVPCLSHRYSMAFHWCPTVCCTYAFVPIQQALRSNPHLLQRWLRDFSGSHRSDSVEQMHVKTSHSFGSQEGTKNASAWAQELVHAYWADLHDTWIDTWIYFSIYMGYACLLWTWFVSWNFSTLDQGKQRPIDFEKALWKTTSRERPWNG